jgi:ATP-dependent Lon protease
VQSVQQGPTDNEADLDKLPDSVRKELSITLVERLEEVIAVAIPQLIDADAPAARNADGDRDDRRATRAIA